MRPSAVFLLPFLAALASPALAMQNEPTGFEKARFGMSPPEVAKLYEGKIQKLDKEYLGSSPVLSPLVHRQALRDMKLPWLQHPVTVELRYWKDRLWVVIVYYGENSQEEVVEGLRKQYGPPDISGHDAVWRGAKVTVNTANRERWYAIADLELSREVQAVFAEDMRRAQEAARARQGGAAPAAPAPAATPAAK